MMKRDDALRGYTEMEARVAEAMRAQIAAAMEESRGGWWNDEDGLQSVQIDGFIDLLAMGRAAIQAMREPTEAMFKAGYETWDKADAGTLEQSWPDMIDAASSKHSP